MKKTFLKTADQRKHMTKHRSEPEGKQLKVGQTWEDTQMRVRMFGKFSEFELGMLVRVFRKIETRHPERNYVLLLESPDLSFGEAQTLIQRLYKLSLDKNGAGKGKAMEDVRSGASKA